MPELPSTHLHGDPRLCHVLFDEGVVTGLIDPDQAVWGERIVDVARAAVSHPDPANAGILAPTLIRAFIAAYDRGAKLTELERSALPAALRAAVVEAVSDVEHFHAKNPSRITDSDIARVKALRGVEW
jgi:Ser/Thr protein kinase RdoA (MazF antagonist)